LRADRSTSLTLAVTVPAQVLPNSLEATVAASDPATDLSLPNIRQATLRWRPTGEHRVRD